MPKTVASKSAGTTTFPNYAEIYAEVWDDPFTIPPIAYEKIDPAFLRQEVDYETSEPVGSIVVDSNAHFLYWILPGKRAVRYGVGLGAQGRAWKGRAYVQWKRKWPTWTPTDAMITRNPRLEKWRTGMPPGLKNALGARALYIFQDGKDTLYRIHGCPDWNSIGKNASSGCVRMFHQDAIDLYNRVKTKPAVLVI